MNLKSNSSKFQENKLEYYSNLLLNNEMIEIKK